MNIFEHIKESSKEEVVKQIYKLSKVCLYCKFSALCRMGNNILLCNLKANLGSEVEK